MSLPACLQALEARAQLDAFVTQVGAPEMWWAPLMTGPEMCRFAVLTAHDD